jgi:hypothetical protein
MMNDLIIFEGDAVAVIEELIRWEFKVCYQY